MISTTAPLVEVCLESGLFTSALSPHACILEMPPAWLTARSPISYIPLILCAILGSAYYLSVVDSHVSVLPSLWLPAIAGDKTAECPNRYTNIDVEIPDGVRVIAIVFFGRREYVKILDCYLKVSRLASVVFLHC